MHVQPLPAPPDLTVTVFTPVHMLVALGVDHPRPRDFHGPCSWAGFHRRVTPSPWHDRLPIRTHATDHHAIHIPTLPQTKNNTISS